jgi:hypothetical protein
MMGAPDANKGRPSLLGSSAPDAAASAAAACGESTRVLAQFGGRDNGKRSFIKRPGVWAALALLIGAAGATTYQLQARRTEASMNIAAAAPAKPAPAVAAAPVAPPVPETPAPAIVATAPAAPEPATARIVEGDTAPPSQQQSTPFAAIGAQPMAVSPAAKPARIAAAKSPRAEKTTTTAAVKKPEHVASSRQPARAANSKPVKTAANASTKTPRRASDSTQTAARSGKPDPDTDLLTALLRRSKAPDPAPQPAALAEVSADCKSGQRCKP